MSDFLQGSLQLYKAKVISSSSQDPLNLHRVQVYIPPIHGDDPTESNQEDKSMYPWANCILLNVGDKAAEEPPVGSVVLVGFEGNDYDNPIVFGIYSSDTAHLGESANQQGIEGSYAGGTLAELAAQVIFGNEGGYTTVAWNDHSCSARPVNMTSTCTCPGSSKGSLSIGKVQWHANNARDIMVKIKAENPTNYVSICNKHGGNLDSLTNESTSWGGYRYWSSTCPNGAALKEILGTEESKKVQDEQAIAFVQGYINAIQAKGVMDPACIIYLADAYNQGPAYALKYAVHCATNKLDLDGLHQAMKNGEAGVYGWINDSNGMNRRNKTYNAVKQLETEGKLTPTALSGVSGNTGTGEIGWPIEDGSGSITSKFGYRNISISSGFHPGVDIGVPIGTRLVAAHDGVIRQNTSGSWGGGLGNSAVIDGGSVGYSTLYAHMNSGIQVAAGTQVKRGQFIGYSGNTGNSTGPHLHFGVYKVSSYKGYGKNDPDHLGAVDPEKVMKKP